MRFPCLGGLLLKAGKTDTPMKKRIFSAMILICLTISVLLYSLHILYATDPYSNSNVDTEGVMHIRTADEFMRFTLLVGNGSEELDAVLENDIDLSYIEGVRRRGSN